MEINVNDQVSIKLDDAPWQPATVVALLKPRSWGTKVINRYGVETRKGVYFEVSAHKIEKVF